MFWENLRDVESLFVVVLCYWRFVFKRALPILGKVDNWMAREPPMPRLLINPLFGPIFAEACTRLDTV